MFSPDLDLHDLAWRQTGEVAIRELDRHSDITGALDLELPLGAVDIAVSMLKDGHGPQHRYSPPVVESPTPEPIGIELTRGAEIRNELVGARPFDAATRKVHLLFLPENSQLDSLRGPFPQQGGPSNLCIGGINIWLREPGLLHQLLSVQGDSAAVGKGPAPGEYSLRAFPDDFVFSPVLVTVGEAVGTAQVRWRARRRRPAHNCLHADGPCRTHARYRCALAGTAMATKLLTGLAAALAVVLIVWLLWSPATPSAPAAPPRGASPAAPAAHPDDVPTRKELDPESTIGSVRGRVLDHHNQPIAGAVVQLISARVGPGQSVLTSVRCDAEGQFAIRCQSSWPPAVKLKVSAADCVTLETTSVQIGGEQILILTRLATAYGRVIAQGTGAPLSGARLSCQDRSAIADADGNYQLGFPPDSPRTSILVQCDGFVDANLPVRAGEAARVRCDFALAPAAALLLQVIDRDTQLPIAGAELARGRSARSARPQRVDKDGRIRLQIGEGEQLQVLVRADGYCQLGWYWTVHDAADRTPRLPLQRVATIAGRARIEGTTAVTRARLRAKNVSMKTGSRAIPSAVQRACDLPGSAFDELPSGDALADADGKFELSVLPDPSPYVVTATLPERVAAESAPVVVATPDARASVELQLRRGGSVSGKVQRNGQCVAGDVSWRQRGDRVWGGRARIGATGDYEVLCVPPGEIELAVQPEGSSVQLQLATVTVPRGEGVHHDFLWEETFGRITGRVTWNDGQPVIGIWVHAEAEDHSCEPVSALLANDGTYSLEVPTGRSYAVQIRLGVIQQTRTPVQVGAEHVNFVLPMLGHLRVLLVDAATQQPLPRKADEMWTFRWRKAGEDQFADASVQFTEDGGFDLQLPVGGVDLLAMLEGSDYHPQLSLGLPVTAADAPAPIDLPIARGVTVRVEVGGEVPFDVRQVRDHLFFLLADGQQDAVRGPFAAGSGQGNQEINGRQVWLRDPSLMEQVATFEGDGTAVLRAQTPGVYSLRAFPDDVEFTPASVTVGEGGGTVRLQWRRK